MVATLDPPDEGLPSKAASVEEKLAALSVASSDAVAAQIGLADVVIGALQDVYHTAPCRVLTACPWTKQVLVRS